MSNTPPSDFEIQDYIDGRLDSDRKKVVQEYLDQNADEANWVKGAHERDVLLRLAAQPVLDEPVPKRLSAVMAMARAGADRDTAADADTTGRRKRNTKTTGAADRWPWWPVVMTGAVATLMLVLGVALGWGGAMLLGSSDRKTAQIATEVMLAYSFYSGETDYAVEFDTSRTEQWNVYMQRIFATEIPPPDITGHGYSYVGARMVPGPASQMAFYLFENKAGDRISLFFWLLGDTKPNSFTSEALGDTFSEEWNDTGFNFVFMAPGGDKHVKIDKDVLSEVRQFYADHFVTMAASN